MMRIDCAKARRLGAALWAGALATVWSPTTFGQDAFKITGIEPERVERGGIIRVTGIGFTGSERLRLCFTPVTDQESCNAQPLLKLEATPTSVAATVLTDTPLTSYRVELLAGDRSFAVGNVEVGPGDVTITNVAPPTPYPAEDEFSLTLFGSGFSIRPDENILVFDDMPALQPCPARGCAENQEGRVQAKVGPLQREITYTGIPFAYHGIHDIRVAVGNSVVSAPQRVTFAQVKEGTPLIVAASVVTGLLIALYFALRQRRRQIPGGSISLGEALFLDEERSAYSLSKFQFYAWTFASLLAYLYLTAARSLVQGSLELSAVPEGLPGVLLASVGTSVLATTISGVKGAQGAGEVGPSFADFFTHGGVVAPERLQFFLWTVVGVLSFLTITLLHPPGEIQDLPAIPETFLTLAGISAAGYLGGKLARKAGPRISAVSPVWRGPGTRGSGQPFGGLSVEGERLSAAPTARFLIGPTATEQAPIEVDIKDPEMQPGATEGDLYRRMVLVPRGAGAGVTPEWLAPARGGKRFYLTIVNPDGQKHVAFYDLPES